MTSLTRLALRMYGHWRLKGKISLAIGDRSKVRLDQISPTSECHVVVGKDCIINSRISFDRAGASFVCGDRCYIGASNVVISKAVTLGDDVVISWGVTLVDHNSHSLRWEDRANDILDWSKGAKDWTHVKVASVNIENKAWIGFNAIILKGVTIGEGAIVAAGAVVTKNVAPYTIVAGNPAQPIRTLTGTEA